jgi:hypothetical protein
MRALGASRTSLVPGGALAGGWARDPLWKTARAVPSLDLRFADNKTLGDAYGGGSPVTFTRASTATFTGSDELIKTAATNEPRFDHNPTTGESLGLLVEEARTNLFLQSNGFDTTWTNTNSSETSLSGTAPDGTNTAWELKDTSDASSVVHALNQSVSFVSGTTYTVSCWMKAGVLTESGFTFPLAAFTFNLSARVSLSTGAVIAVSSGVTATTQQFPNGWWRVSATATATATASASMQVRIMNGGVAYIGTGTGTILIWGAQIEAGAFATSYIPTTTATVTRAADVASITGSNFSSFYNQTEGTVFTDSSINYTIPGALFPLVSSLNDNTSNNRIENGFLTSTLAGYEVVASGSAQVGVYPNASSALTRKLATNYQLNNFAVSVNGGSVSTDTSGIVPTVSQLRIGDRVGGAGNTLNGTIKRLVYWGQRLPNNVLQAITQ